MSVNCSSDTPMVTQSDAPHWMAEKQKLLFVTVLTLTFKTQLVLIDCRIGVNSHVRPEHFALKRVLCSKRS